MIRTNCDLGQQLGLVCMTNRPLICCSRVAGICRYVQRHFWGSLSPYANVRGASAWSVASGIPGIFSPCKAYFLPATGDELNIWLGGMTKATEKCS